ncbi:G-box-binding factor 4-like [Abrus precatorius]|uniref:G-box-binding factor 4-like n=1 Tax=Abrus precatorius TaxID=3816 RepID=A0A8B8LFU9_ABRPR|nr:G-box-binding factor 4-like [Abrus precatorius]
MTSSKVDLPRQGSVSNLLADEVWEEVVGGATESTISLEDFLTKATSVVRNDTVRGKRKAVEEPLDKATLQKQRRMIKNRESAARSRERKQAYTVELESLVTHLEKENALLLKEEADRKRQRFEQLMECLVSVEEKPRLKKKLRRVNSTQW